MGAVSIEGYAFESNEAELVQQRRDRVQQIGHLLPFLEVKKSPSHGRTFFRGVLPTPETQGDFSSWEAVP